jgi:hypothetical protein
VTLHNGNVPVTFDFKIQNFLGFFRHMGRSWEFSHMESTGGKPNLRKGVQRLTKRKQFGTKNAGIRGPVGEGFVNGQRV